jgi:hypothetical protein
VLEVQLKEARGLAGESDRKYDEVRWFDFRREKQVYFDLGSTKTINSRK